MHLSVWDEIIVVAYLAAIMSIGFAMKRKAAKGMSSYFLGGRQLPWWALAMSGSSSYFDITGTMWIVSTFIALGLKGMWVHMLWGFPITAFYLAYMGKWIRRSDAMTGAEWMKTRFGTGKAGDIARLSYTLFADSDHLRAAWIQCDRDGKIRVDIPAIHAKPMRVSDTWCHRTICDPRRLSRHCPR